MLRRILLFLCSKSFDGEIHPPGAHTGAAWKNQDGSHLAVIAQGDALDIFVGKKETFSFSIPTSSAVGLSRWILKWWFLTMLLGFRWRLWLWVTAALYDEEIR
jgi:hypothetical protein